MSTEFMQRDRSKHPPVYKSVATERTSSRRFVSMEFAMMERAEKEVLIRAI